MPDHIHGILRLKDNAMPSNSHFDTSPGENRYQNIGTNSISSIICSYKSAVTKHCNRLNFKIVWQTKFYDRVVRNENELQRISNYIINNPKNWNKKLLGELLE